jgi:hypothetical protein
VLDAGVGGAASAGNGLDNLHLFTILFDKMADEDEAVHAPMRGFQERQGFKALQAGVVGVDGAVVAGEWVRVWCGRVIHAADLLIRSVEPPESSDLVGGISV